MAVLYQALHRDRGASSRGVGSRAVDLMIHCPSSAGDANPWLAAGFLFVRSDQTADERDAAFSRPAIDSSVPESSATTLPALKT